MRRGLNGNGASALLDHVDQQIVAVLQADPRASWTEIARVIDVSEATVSRRARRLLESRVLVLSAARNPEADTSTSDVFILLKCTVGMSRSVAAALAELDEVRFTAIITGAFDIIVEAAFLSGAALNALVLDTIAAIPGVESVQTLAVLHNFKTDNAWARGVLDPTRTEGLPVGPGGRIPSEARTGSDELEESLSRELAENPRATNAELAGKLGVSEAVVRRRVDALISSGRVHLSSYIAPSLMGFAFEAFLWLDIEAGAMERMASALGAVPSVRYISSTAGSYNLLVEVVFRDRDEIHHFLSTTLSELGEVRKSELILQLQTIKRNYTRVTE